LISPSNRCIIETIEKKRNFHLPSLSVKVDWKGRVEKRGISIFLLLYPSGLIGGGER